MDTLYIVLIFLSILVSIVLSFVFFNNNKHLLLDSSNKLKNGWGLYKVKLKNYENNFLESPTLQEKCLYYSANIFFEEKIMTEKNNKKKSVDIKYYKDNINRNIDNNFYIILNGKELKVNSKQIKIDTTTKVLEDVDLKLEENKEILYLEEKTLVENKLYYIMIEFINKKPNLKSIIITDNNHNFKNEMFFKLGLIWFPSIMFLASYFLL